jgi:pilus assembly protein Flp/PilA
MSRIKDYLNKQLLRLMTFAQENGQTLVEYGMIVALLSIAAVAILTVVGKDVTNLFTKVSSDFQEIESRTP